ncbi:hypothetical protein NU688_28340 [Variovorax sp. ZS18.2.2]|uniref:hypothetical protein n=1 Tax=Variovorax sp. ZS18.2.2 TaxID=2971255 RepID=UPI0021518F32|nr:hypothetical protein [Variovorax sp. ZS18.2.2]MCR6480097.1 hypothetical protein [Variovorax sp. ZS18.2.2]
MSIRPRSMIFLAWFAMAALSAPAMADGVPGVRHAKSTSHREAPMTTAARKPNDSGVTLRFRLDAVPQVGRGTPVVLEFGGVSDPDGATVRFSADAGLTVSGSDTLALPRARRTSATVTVVSEREGLTYLNVFITQKGAMSAISIPIQTGTAVPVLKSSGELKSTPDGENIITMPAR